MRRHLGTSAACVIALLASLPAVAVAAPPRNFEGPAVTDLIASDAPPPAPEIAVGPDDVLLGASTLLVRLPNPNAKGRTPSTNLADQRVFLDTWLGNTVLPTLCPTSPQTSASCVFDNLTVRYDQMQGRFVVLFTVTDTGIVGTAITSPRKANWVLLVSRFASLAPRAAGATTDSVFTAAGGVNPNVWNVWYGNAVNGLGTDGFGSLPSPGGVGVGNINSLPGITAAPNPTIFDCRPSAIAAAGVTPTSVCYFPTSARLGLDNDTITIASPVINVNINPADRSATYDPPTTPAYAGTRIRVIKKTDLYTGASLGTPLVAGNQFAATEATRFIGSYYDLYSSPDGLGTPIVATPPMPFTAVVSNDAPETGNPVTPPAAPNWLSPLFYEPAQLRGRTLASFANAPALGSGGTFSSQTYLLGAIATPFGTSLNESALYVQGIQHVYDTVAGPPASGPIPFYPILTNDTDTVSSAAGTRRGFPESFPVVSFTDPGPVAQARYRDPPAGPGGVAPSLFIGDSRPQRVIFREGHLYDARTVAARDQFTFNGNPLSSTVTYDVLSKIAIDAPVEPVIETEWDNTRAFAPMFDVPANVATAGQASPINLQPFLEKLFVGTTRPPLFPSFSSGRDPRALDNTGQHIPDAQCFGSPSPPDFLAWPGLFDMRCGSDPYDSEFLIGNPATGIVQNQVPFSVRGDASTDPNNGALWLYGAYTRRRVATPPTGQWGTYVANYPLDVPSVDPYGNPTAFYVDVPPPSGKAQPSPLFLSAQILRQVGIGPQGTQFGPKTKVRRAEMARAVILAQMDDRAITDYLNATGGLSTSHFEDVPSTDLFYPYVETMFRRGYTKGCSSTTPVKYCPNDPTTRGEMAVFIVRAKLGNVFPSAITGCASSSIFECGAGLDNWGLFISTEPYFKDVKNEADPLYPYIQKMAELRIIGGEVPLGKNGLNGKFSAAKPLTRAELATFIVRAFFL